MAKKAPGIFRKPLKEKSFNRLVKYLEQPEDQTFLKSCYVLKPGNAEEKIPDRYVIKDELDANELKRLKSLAKAIKVNKQGPVKLIPLVAFGALVVGAVFFFTVMLDPLLSKYLTLGLEEVFEAKCDVRGFHLGLLRFRIGISSLTVANRDRPMTNLFETERLEIRLRPQAVLRGKIYIEEIRADGLAFGTARTVSGALPRFAARIAERQSRPPAPPLIDLAKFDAWGLLNREYDKLQSPKAYDRTIAAYNEAKTRWENQYQSANTKVKEVQAKGQPLLSTNVANLRSAEEITTYVTDVNAFINTLESARNEVAAVTDGVQKDINTALELEQTARDAITADINHLKDYLDLGSGSALEALEPSIREILSDQAEEYIMYGRRALESLEKLKAMQAMIPKSEPKPETVVYKGRDVHFPTPAYPKFYLGVMASDFTLKDWNYAFELKSVSSAPDISNRPTELNLGLTELGAKGRTASFAGSADFRSNAQTYFTALVGGGNFPLDIKTGLSSAGFGGFAGTTDFTVNVSGGRGGAFTLGGDIRVRNAVISDPVGTIAEAVVEALSASLADFPWVELGMQYEHIINDSDRFSLTTNIDDLIKDAVRRTVQRYLRQAEEAIEQALREKLDEYLVGKWVSKEEVDLIFAAVKGDSSALDSLKSSLEAKRAEAEQRIRGQVDAAVEEAKDEARSQIQDNVRGALGGIKLPF